MEATPHELEPGERSADVLKKAPVRRSLWELMEDALVFLLAAPIRLYRLVLSPAVGQVCRFHPSCSRYALGALHAHGPFKGSWLTVKRLARCQPFHPGGIDPVPPPRGRRARRLGVPE